MKVFIPALALAILITASAFAPSAYAARRSVPQVRSGACPPRFRWIVAMLSLLPGRDLPGTSGTRVAEARWVVSSRGLAPIHPTRICARNRPF
jgi:hypothetical protein